MPSVSERQRKFMGAELSRLRAGEKTRTGMTEGQLTDFASKKAGHEKTSGGADSYERVVRRARARRFVANGRYSR